MATINITAPKPMVMADLKGKVDPDWCPGCGDFGVLAAVQKALVELQIRYLVPLHGDAIIDILGKSKHTIIIENNFTGQFARYLRSETSFVANGHIRKYDGEPFMPHHIVEAVREQLAGRTTLSVPTHEVMV